MHRDDERDEPGDPIGPRPKVWRAGRPSRRFMRRRVRRAGSTKPQKILRGATSVKSSMKSVAIHLIIVGSGVEAMAKPNGKTAFITGSTDGVGRVVAKMLGAASWRVLVHGRDRKRGGRVVAEIRDAGGSAEFLAADLSSLAEVRRLADGVRNTTSRLDLLINNAGIGSGGPQ